MGAVAPPGPVTLGDELARIAPGQSWLALSQWPPDVFAVTSTVLAESGAYRTVVCPPEGASWPPPQNAGEARSWETMVALRGREWAVWAASSESPPAAGFAPTPPPVVARLCAVLDAMTGLPIMELDEGGHWDTVVALLSLHAMADEACVGAGLESGTDFQRVALAELEQTGSLARIPSDRVRVLPKLRTPEAGITLRSLSHHLALDRSEVWPSWLRVPAADAPDDHGQGRLTLLLVPYPATVHANDFRPIRGPLLNMDPQRFGFFEYAPTEPLEPDWVIGLVETGRRRVGKIDAVVLPESALEESAVPMMQERLAEAGVPYLISGVRRQASEEQPFGANYAYIGGADWHAAQHKHHRWCLDAAQVHQYHLGAALDPNHRWWEAIRVQRRTLTFVTTPEPSGLTICPLVCEDLARPDPVTDVVRAVAPTLVVGLLLDGPQLAARWPARYASVLADDPGCSVLTLTSLGMAWRSQPAGFSPSRVVALWKDPHRGLQQIALADDARAVALTAHQRQVRVTTADGRASPRPIAELVLSGLEQVE